MIEKRERKRFYNNLHVYCSSFPFHFILLLLFSNDFLFSICSSSFLVFHVEFVLCSSPSCAVSVASDVISFLSFTDIMNAYSSYVLSLDYVSLSECDASLELSRRRELSS